MLGQARARNKLKQQIKSYLCSIREFFSYFFQYYRVYAIKSMKRTYQLFLVLYTIMIFNFRCFF